MARLYHIFAHKWCGRIKVLMDTIKLRNVTKKFKLKSGEVSALTNINLDIVAGDFVAIRGESGSGKSTLLQIMSGLDVPSSGEVVVENQNLSKMKDKQLAKFRSEVFGFVFQSFYLHPLLTMRQNIELPACFSGMSDEKRAIRTKELVDFLGMGELIDRLPTELSGGQCQRAAILRAIYNQPKIMFADEPTGNLDLKSSNQVLDLLKRVNERLGITVILATHDTNMSEAARRIINIDHGEII